MTTATPTRHRQQADRHLRQPQAANARQVVSGTFKFLFFSIVMLCWLSGCSWGYDTYTIVNAEGDPLSGVYVSPQALRYNSMSRSNEDGRLKDSIKKSNGDKIILIKDGYGYAYVVKDDGNTYYLPNNIHLCPEPLNPYSYVQSIEEEWSKRTGEPIPHPKLQGTTDFEQGTILDAWSGDYWIPHGHEDFYSAINRDLESNTVCEKP